MNIIHIIKRILAVSNRELIPRTQWCFSNKQCTGIFWTSLLNCLSWGRAVCAQLSLSITIFICLSAAFYQIWNAVSCKISDYRNVKMWKNCLSSSQWSTVSLSLPLSLPPSVLPAFSLPCLFLCYLSIYLPNYSIAEMFT